MRIGTQAGGERPLASLAGRAPAQVSRWWRGRTAWSPGRIVAAYALVSLLWIAFSDAVLVRLVPDPALRARAQTVKGAFFVVVTSALLLELIRRGDLGLRTLGAEVRATVDSMADAVLLVDEEGRIVETNRAAVELLGVASKEDLLVPLRDWGRRFDLRYLDGSPVPYDRYAAVRALAGERIKAYDAMARRADGSEVYFSVSAAPVKGAGHRLLAVAVLRDVTAARRLDEMREEFLATAAHEFKTPLAVVKAYAQLMQKRAPGDPGLTVIQRQVDRLNRLVQHLLDTSRLRLQPGEGRRDTFDVSSLVAEAIEEARPSTPGHALEAEAPAPAVVHADRERILRVLTSLLDNAIRFSPAGGPVQVRVETHEGEVVVSVADHGLGIPPERQPRIFERYYRAHAGTDQDYGGLGLGLDMSREIVTRHGGRMWFESVPGQGSTFHFSLPLAAQEAS